MNCPKCNSVIKDNATVCPVCHKVLSLECPNCHSIGESAVCEKCGYTILVKCSKCSKINPITNETCSKCGFSLNTSLAYQECETDDFASIIVKFGSLKNIKRALKSSELYAKFIIKLKNLLYSHVKSVDCKMITYGDTFAINMNKELSFPTSSNKAVRLALKITNAFADVNSNLIDEIGIPLNLTITIVKKRAENLQELISYNSNVKPLIIKKNQKKYLKGLQIILDQYVRDEITKEFTTDSLYSIEENSKQIIFYELLLDKYVLPPSNQTTDSPITVKQTISAVKKNNPETIKPQFKVLDINAKCKFVSIPSLNLFSELNSDKSKIISIRAEKNLLPDTAELYKQLQKNNMRILKVSCSEEMQYKPWGFFDNLFREFHNLSINNLSNNTSNISEEILKTNKILFNLINYIPTKSMTPEDARFTYIDAWCNFLKKLSSTAIIIDGYEYLDATSLQTLELYFDKYKKIVPTFIFITSTKTKLHSKIASLLRTNMYSEYALIPNSLDACLSTLKSDGTDFIQSFYYEKIKENFNGSYLYFSNALKYLQDSGVLLDFEDKLIIRSNKSVVIPPSIDELFKTRIKHLSKNMDISLIFAYSSILGARLDFQTLIELGIKDIETNTNTLVNSGLAYVDNNCIYVSNYQILKPIIQSSLKKAAEEFLAKNILAKLSKGLDNATQAILMGKLGAFKEEYLILWKNSIFAIKTGDYDSYLVNCLGFLSLVKHIESNISEEEIEENKKEVYSNILSCLYNYAPEKIYDIENILLRDAFNQNDDEKIVKLSNLMLQGALISSNYGSALELLHNILARMEFPILIVDGEINTKFLLLSLVNVEILYNIGDFRTCADIVQDVLKVLTHEVIQKVKPANFSVSLFISHILDTCRLGAFAKLWLMDNDLTDYFNQIETSLGTELPDKDCILAIRDFFAGKIYMPQNIESYSAFSKMIFLILQEFNERQNDFKQFAQNIYQAKLLALELHQKEIELFCDLMIAYSYERLDNREKAVLIYNDVMETSQKISMFNINLLAKYLLSLHSDNENQLIIVNNALEALQKSNNENKILYALFEQLYIKIAEENSLSINIKSEKEKLTPFKDSLKIFLTINQIDD